MVYALVIIFQPNRSDMHFSLDFASSVVLVRQYAD